MNRRLVLFCMMVAFVLGIGARAQAQEPWWNQYLTPGTGSPYEFTTIQGEFGEPTVDAETGFGIAARETAYPGNKAKAVALKSYGYYFVPYAEAAGTSTNYLNHYSMAGGWTTSLHTHWHNWTGVTAADVTAPSGYLDFMGMWVFLSEEPWVLGLQGTFPGVKTTPASDLGFTVDDIKYPDGTVAVDAEDFFGATAAKSYLGDVHYEDPPFAASSSLNSTIAAEVAALIPSFFDNPLPANPTGKHSILPISKDIAAPVWQKYGNEIARFYCVDYEGDGVHYDNVGGWNTHSQHPKNRSFGDWSIDGFRTYLANHPGIYGGDPSTFDMRQYVQDTVTGGRALNSLAWLDDPLWRAFLLHKRDEINTFTTGLRDYIHALGTTLGRDLAIIGNDLPFATNAAIGPHNMDAAGYEFSPHVGSGQHPYFGEGTKFPPFGRACAFYQCVNAQTAGRFNYPWYYVGETYVDMPNLSTALFYEALANDSILIPSLTVSSGPAGFTNRAGTVDSVTACNSFMKTAREVWGDRRKATHIAVVHSTQTQMAMMTVEMFSDWDHVQGVLGWNTFLADMHYQYEVVRQEDVGAVYLSGIDLLVVPNCDVFGPTQVAVIQTWVTAGGKLIVTGDSGNRDDDQNNWDSLSSFSFQPLTGVGSLPGAGYTSASDVGAGRVVYLNDNVGQTYYNAIDDYGTSQRAAGKAAMDQALVDIGVLPSAILVGTSADLLVGIRVFEDVVAGNLQADFHNYNVSSSTDVLIPSPAVGVDFLLPPFLSGETIRAFLVSPDVPGYFQPVDPADIVQVGDDVSINVGSVTFFKTLILEPDNSPPGVLVTAPLAADVVVGPEGGAISVDFAWDIVGQGMFTHFEYSLHEEGAAPSFTMLVMTARTLNLVLPDDGRYVFEIRTVDSGAGGITGPTAARGFWTDNSAPTSEVTVGPAEDQTIYLPSGLTTLSVIMGYNAVDPSGIEQFEIAIHATGSPGTLSVLPNPIQNACGFGLGVGDWTLDVRATDTNGYVGPVASRNFHIAPTDLVPPDTTITSGPSGYVDTANVSFTFESDDPLVALYRYRLSPVETEWQETSVAIVSYSSLAEGAYTFEVAAVDPAENEDPTPATASFTVDTIAPTVTIDSGPSGDIVATDVTFGWSADEATIADYYYRLVPDEVSYTQTPLTSASYSGLVLGSYTFEVYAIDLAGNTGAVASRPFNIVPAAVSVTVETSPAGLAIVVDTTAYIAPQTFAWDEGTTHTLGAPVIQNEAAGVRDTFASWSDAGAATHDIVVPGAPVTYTAAYVTQYELTTDVSPPGAGSVVSDPVSPDDWYDTGTSVEVLGAPAASYVFNAWSGDASGSANPETLLMDAPKAVTAGFASADVTVTVDTGTTVSTDIVGPGIEDNAFFWAPWNQNFGLTAEDYLLVTDRIRKMEPEYVRAFIALNMCQPKDGIYDWDNYGMDSLYQHLDIYEGIGAPVVLAGFEWQLPRWMVPYATSYWNPDHQELAEALAALVNHLIVDKGYTCVQEVTLLNEPDWGLFGGIAAYTDCIQRLDTELVNLGIRGLVKINGPDCCAPNDAYFEASTLQHDAYHDVWCDHMYNDPLVLAADIDERIQWIQDNDTDGIIEPLAIGEFNGLNVAADHGTWDFAFATTDMAVTMLSHGVDRFAYWLVQDINHGPTHTWPADNGLGLWRFKQPPASSYADFEMRPVYYTYGALVMKYIEGGSDVLSAASSSGDVNVAVTRSSGGYFTVVATNRGASAVSLNVAGLSGVASLEVYQLEAATVPTDDRLAVDLSGSVTVTAGVFTDVLPGESVTVYTNLPARDTTPPVISGLAATPLGPDSYEITWMTDYPADSQVEYSDVDNPLSWYTVTDHALVTSHSVTLSGLMLGADYEVRARSKDNVVSDIARSAPIAVSTAPGSGFHDNFATYDVIEYQETVSFGTRHWCLDYVQDGKLHYDSDATRDSDVRAYLFRDQPTNSDYVSVELHEVSSLVEVGGWDVVALAFMSTLEPTWVHGDGYEFNCSPRYGTFSLTRRENYAGTNVPLSENTFALPARLEIRIDRTTTPDTYTFYIAGTLVATDLYDFGYPPHYAGIFMATSNATTNAITSTWDNLSDYEFGMPDTFITAGPVGYIDTPDVSFDFDSDDPTVALYRYRLSPIEVTWQETALTAVSYVGLADGDYLFEVAAVAPGDIQDPTPATASFTVDTVDPTVTIDSGPSGDIVDTDVTFGWSADEGTIADYYYRLVPVEVPYNQTALTSASYAGLGLGAHTFEVYAVDLAGNTGAVASQSFNIIPAVVVDVTVATVPAGLDIVVDSVTHTAPQTFSWNEGDTHTLSASLVQNEAGGMRQSFDFWSDAGAATHDIVVPSAPVTFTATYALQYELTTSVAPVGGGSVSASPVSADGWYDDGTPVDLTAVPGSSYDFDSWSGGASGSANPTLVLMDGPKSITADFIASGNPPMYPGTLKAYWKLEEASGTRVDATGNGYDLSEQGGVGSAAGVFDDAAAFDNAAGHRLYEPVGVNDLNWGGTYDVGDQIGSVSCWFKGTSGAKAYTLATAGGSWALRLGGADVRQGQIGMILVRGNSTNWWVWSGPGATYDDDQWHHLVMRLDITGPVYSPALRLSVYVDGGLVIEKVDWGNASVHDAARINISQGGTIRTWNGRVDDFAVWKGAVLAVSDIQTLWNGGAGASVDELYQVPAPTGYWRLDEASGVRVDSSGSYDLSESSAVASVAGMFADAAQFDNASAHRLYGGTAMGALDWGGSYLVGQDIGSLSCWFKGTSGATSYTLATAGGCWALRLGGADRHEGQVGLFSVLANGTKWWCWSSSSVGYDDDAWHFLVLTLECTNDGGGPGLRLRVYVDNEQVINSTTTADTGLHSATRLSISQGGGVRTWNGLVDDFGMWAGKVLGESARDGLWNSGAGTSIGDFFGVAAAMGPGATAFKVKALGGTAALDSTSAPGQVAALPRTAYSSSSVQMAMRDVTAGEQVASAIGALAPGRLPRSARLPADAERRAPANVVTTRDGAGKLSNVVEEPTTLLVVTERAGRDWPTQDASLRLIWQGMLAVPELGATGVVDAVADGTLCRVRFETAAECPEGALLVVVIEQPGSVPRVLLRLPDAGRHVQACTVGLVPGAYELKVYTVGPAVLEKLAVTGR